MISIPPGIPPLPGHFTRMWRRTLIALPRLSLHFRPSAVSMRFTIGPKESKDKVGDQPENVA